jgi:hypothetical protein
MPESYILGIQSNGEDLQKRVLLRLVWSRTATRHDICDGTALEHVVLDLPPNRLSLGSTLALPYALRVNETTDSS